MKNKEIEEILYILKDIVIGRATRLTCREADKLLSYIEQLEKRNKELYEGFIATQEELTDYATKNEQLENNRDKALKIIDGYELGKYDYSIPAEGIIELREILKNETNKRNIN